MKRSKIILVRATLYMVGLVWGGVLAHRVYSGFHPSPGFIASGPDGGHVIDCVLSGFVDVSYDFRAHDLSVSPLEPIVLGDLCWEGRYYSGDLFWSRDGTVAAVSIVFSDGSGEALACAYDFREHRAIRAGRLGSPLEATCDAQIRGLLESRGGYSRQWLPEPKEL